jgi:hypothetical protein
MTDNINFTWLRLAMLDAVRAGRVALRQGEWSFRSRPSTKSQMVRAVKSLQFAGLVEIAADGQAVLTEQGEKRRTEWEPRG